MNYPGIFESGYRAGQSGDLALAGVLLALLIGGALMVAWMRRRR